MQMNATLMQSQGLWRQIHSISDNSATIDNRIDRDWSDAEIGIAGVSGLADNKAIATAIAYIENEGIVLADRLRPQIERVRREFQ